MNPRILIVEDDEFSRGAMEKVLQSYGYETCSCRDGEEAISRLEKGCFDILITDLHMPGMDGFELIQKAKMNPRRPHNNTDNWFFNRRRKK